MDCKTALQTILDHVDYTTGACQVNEMIGAVLPKEIILLAKQTIADESQVAPRESETMRAIISPRLIIEV